MALTPGARFGSYEILSALGSGGMGEVYRATDTSLKRQVAIKVLPSSLAGDPDRVARFQREAEVLAALNHPNIAHLYGLERSGGALALVMELVEGPTLADRLAKGPIALDEALPIAQQMTEALDAAHAQSIIHRDLKPANIKVREDGTVKVLDFGLAKLVDGARVAETEVDGNARGALSNSPTIASPALLTSVGVLLGTAPYMSPEQALGKAVDGSADIWAFGCVLFEMLTGSRAFGGADTTTTIAAILRSEPDWSQLPPDTPPRIRRVLRRCVAKDRKRRLADIRDAWLDIADEKSETANTEPLGVSRTRERILWSATCALLASIAAFIAFWTGSRQRSNAPVAEMHVEITTPPSADQVSLAISPDGQKLAFVAIADRRHVLWVRSLASGVAQPLSGSDDASFPFWSPDSRSIGFFADGKLNRVDVDGGNHRVLASAPVGSGGTWGPDGTILYTMVPDAPVEQVSAEIGGGPPGPPGTLTPQGHRFPQFLPDGRHYLYFVAEPAVRGVYIANLDGSDQRRLFDADAAAVFVPPGRVLFVRAGTLFVQRFDAVGRQIVGDPVPIARGVNVDMVGAAAISASATGSIVFRPGTANRQRQLEWFDRAGRSLGTVGTPDPGSALNPALSPDGRQLALNRSVDGNADIWLLDLSRGVPIRFTFDPTPEIYPVWSPDGHTLLYAHMDRANTGFTLYRKPSTGDGPATPLLETSQNAVPLDWSRDGRYVLYRTLQAAGDWNIDAVAVNGTERPAIPVAHTNFDEQTGQFSPDGRWVAFESNESGRYEIYVQAFPTAAAKTLVSTSGGIEPRWSPNGSELFYVAPDSRMMAVAIHAGSDRSRIEPSAPVPLFLTDVGSTHTSGSGEEYAVASDGRFLIARRVEQASMPITLVLNATALRN